MLLALRAKNKLGFINGSCRKPADNHPTLHQRERCNAIVLSWLMSSVSKEIFSGIIYCTEASAVWTDLKERFDKICGSRIFSLHREISHLSQGSSSISMYFSNLKKLWDEYSSLVTLPSCGCATAKAYLDHDQHQRLLQFLMGLNETYGHVRSQILMLDPLPSVNQAYSIVSQEGSHRAALSSHLNAELPDVAFFLLRIKKWIQ
ncbi:uncharacterized protein LOC142523778 [Primulina tabacum]|uniref:uncharacterized protein LOC142523778 n=1 Tax=Primulina tabacum TaxID=48773 RepID=UPI003F591BC9